MGFEWACAHGRPFKSRMGLDRARYLGGEVSLTSYSCHIVRELRHFRLLCFCPTNNAIDLRHIHMIHTPMSA